MHAALAITVGGLFTTGSARRPVPRAGRTARPSSTTSSRTCTSDGPRAARTPGTPGKRSRRTATPTVWSRACLPPAGFTHPRPHRRPVGGLVKRCGPVTGRPPDATRKRRRSGPARSSRMERQAHDLRCRLLGQVSTCVSTCVSIVSCTPFPAVFPWPAPSAVSRKGPRPRRLRRKSFAAARTSRAPSHSSQYSTSGTRRKRYLRLGLGAECAESANNG
jgi:hypothetical protein